MARTFRNVADHRRLVRVRDADGGLQELTTTDGHPFFVVGSGWVLASGLAAGDHLLQADGRPAVVLSTAREAHPGGVAIFNFEVQGHHNYFVAEAPGREPVLVHNISAAELIDLLKSWSELVKQHDALQPGQISERLRIVEEMTGIVDKLKGAGIDPFVTPLN